MTHVDFYILADVTDTRDKFACILAGKAVKQGLGIHIHTDTRESAMLMDDLMWTFRDISFIPHSLADSDSRSGEPVTIGWNGSTPRTHEILINLGAGVPAFAGSFDRIMEIVPADEDSRARSRDRYRKYRELGFELRTHEMGSEDADT